MDSLTIEQRRSGDVLILDLSGQITLGATNRQLQDAIRQLVAEGERSMILNLAKVKYIDSTGLGELVAGYSTLKRNEGRLALINVSDRVMDLMTITKLYTVFDIYDVEAAAVESFASNASSAATFATGFASSRLS